MCQRLLLIEQVAAYTSVLGSTSDSTHITHQGVTAEAAMDFQSVRGTSLNQYQRFSRDGEISAN